MLAIAGSVAALLALALAAGSLAAGGEFEEEEKVFASLGSECEATGGSIANTTFQHELSTYRFYTRAPYNGVVTQWVVRIGYETKGYPLALSVINQLGESHDYEVRAQSAPAEVKRGTTTVPARLPIFKGETVALTSIGEGPMPYCETDHPRENNVFSTGRALKQGESSSFYGIVGQVPVEATVEPDADRDGYGDGSQDACPHSKKRHKKPCSLP